MVIQQGNRLGFNSDAALTLNIHPVEVLGPHLSGVHNAGELKHAIGEGGLSMIDVSDNREIPNVFCIHAVSCQTVFFKIYL